MASSNGLFSGSLVVKEYLRPSAKVGEEQGLCFHPALSTLGKLFEEGGFSHEETFQQRPRIGICMAGPIRNIQNPLDHCMFVVFPAAMFIRPANFLSRFTFFSELSRMGKLRLLQNKS